MKHRLDIRMEVWDEKNEWMQQHKFRHVRVFSSFLSGPFQKWAHLDEDCVQGRFRKAVKSGTAFLTERSVDGLTAIGPFVNVHL